MRNLFLPDDYQKDIESKKHVEISDVLASFEEENDGRRFGDRDTVTVCGMITAKTVKNTRTGAPMAFITVEDRYAEMEIVVFPKQYAAYADVLLTDTAVSVTGNLSEREDEPVKLIASNVAPLRTNRPVEEQ